MKPRARYYPDTDSLVIQLADRPAVEAEEVADDILLSYDENNQVIAIEFPGSVRELFKDVISKTSADVGGKQKKAS